MNFLIYKNVKLNSKIESFSLKFNFLTCGIEPRKINIGDISHRIHPIAGQGWNMTVRDIKQLYDVYQNKKKYGYDLVFDIHGDEGCKNHFLVRNYYCNHTLFDVINEKINNKPLNPVSRFHLGNGASIYDIIINGNVSEYGYKESFGIMINYFYNIEKLEKVHENYIVNGQIEIGKNISKIIGK